MHEGQDVDDHTVIAAEHARRAIADADAKLARYRAALESGTDPALIATWTAEVTAAKTTAQAQLRALTGRRRMTEDEIATIVAAAGNVLAVLRNADPEDKTAIYRQLGLRLTYEPGTRTVLAEANPSAIMYETECPRGDLNPPSSHTRCKRVCMRSKLLVWQGIRQCGLLSRRQLSPTAKGGGHRPSRNPRVRTEPPADGALYCQEGIPAAPLPSARDRACRRPRPRSEPRSGKPDGVGRAVPQR